MHLTDAVIQSDFQCIQGIHFLNIVFPGNWTHNLCAAKAMLYLWATGTRFLERQQLNMITDCMEPQPRPSWLVLPLKM